MTLRGADLLERVLDSRLSDVHTALPCKVEAWDSSAQTVDVQPQIKNVILGEETEAEESYPRLLNIPVIFDRGDGAFLAFPLGVGDIVQVLFNEWSIDHFREKGTEVHPVDFSRHSFAGAVALAGGPYSASDPITETIDAVLLGYDGGALLRINDDDTMELGTTASTKQPAALGDDTKTEINALRSAVDTLTTDVNALKTVFTGWVPVPMDGGAALKTAATAWAGAPVSSPPAVNDVGSTKIEIAE
jgi:hypothetical protein